MFLIKINNVSKIFSLFISIFTGVNKLPVCSFNEATIGNNNEFTYDKLELCSFSFVLSTTVCKPSFKIFTALFVTVTASLDTFIIFFVDSSATLIIFFAISDLIFITKIPRK